MEWTSEQNAIINSSGNIKINAVAGSGKTTTVIEYAKSKPKQSKILYIAFNKAVKLEAVKKFAEKNLSNVTVETAHSLAYKHIVYKHGYKIRQLGYKTNEIAELLKLKGDEEKHTEYIIANHINKFITYFCNSDKAKVQQLNYLDTISDKLAKKFVSHFYPYIESQTRLLLSKMDKGEIEITHDFYLKKFQLAYIDLNYDYILFDEGQDASAAMLDIFLQQKAVKVIVGDTNQQIYGWRHAVNSLERVEFTKFDLSTSFRFGNEFATLAMNVIKWKNLFLPEHSIKIEGKGKDVKIKTKAILARTNLGLLLKAIEYVSDTRNKKEIYFEGNINSYTYADDGASLYDVLNLYNGKTNYIKDKLIGSMNSLEELEEYIEKTEDAQLSMMVEIVLEYGNDIPDLIKKIKERHVDKDQKERAEMIFSTVHRCKGMEYDSVELVNDFITEGKIRKQLEESKKENVSFAKLNEEVNLLYVAVTRARVKLTIPEELLPHEFTPSSNIVVIKRLDEEVTAKTSTPKKNTKNYTNKTNDGGGAQSKKIKISPPEITKGPWDIEDDLTLSKMYFDNISLDDISLHLKRTKAAIRARIKKLELTNTFGC